jgi:hypothetical protein
MQSAPPEDTGFIRSRGMRFPKHPQIIQGKIRRLLRSDSYEAKEAEAALRVVREGDVVVELGGGIGFMSTLVATKRAVKSVHVYEANPNLIPYIQSVHAANTVTNAHVTNAVLGAQDGSVDFYIRDPMLGSSMQVNARNAFADIGATVMICDIEGAEVDLIPQLDLTGLRAAIIETHPQWIGPKGINTVFRAFMDAGLAYYHRGSQGKVIAFRKAW